MGWERERTGRPDLATMEARLELAPEDRFSSYVDYASIVPGYDEFVGQVGEAEARETLDYLFHFWNTSDRLLAEHEFADWRWPLDPHDYLAYELAEHLHRLGQEGLATLAREGLDLQLVYLISDGLRRYYTPVMRRALARRARKLARRTPGSMLAAQAEALVLAAEDLEPPPIAISLLGESFRRALVEATLALTTTIEREWAEHPAALDRWLEGVRAASDEQPASEAVSRLVQAGPQALPAATHLVFYEGYECDDYPVRAGLEVLAATPSHQSLWALRQIIVGCPTLSAWAATQLAAHMPALACDYFRCLLRAPEPAPAALAARGLEVLAQAECPDALDLASLALRYHVEDAAQTEAVQVAAGLALLALDDPAAVPHLRAYLSDEAANPAAQAQIVRTINRLGEGWWRQVVSGP